MTETMVDLGRLMIMSKADLDDLFKRSPAGSLPHGEADGTAIIGSSSFVRRTLAKLVCWFCWQGKVFDETDGSLVNRISVVGIRAIKAKVYKDRSWLDENECIVLDYSKTSVVARKVRDEIREVAPGLYLGKVYWGKKRLIDFALTFKKKRASELS